MNLGSSFCRSRAAWYSFWRLFGFCACSSARCFSLGVHIFDF
jgi:hypothetical protein